MNFKEFEDGLQVEIEFFEKVPKSLMRHLPALHHINTNASNTFTLSLRATNGSVAILRSRCEGEARGNLTQSVILRPSPTVILSVAKNLIGRLRLNSAKNLVEILRALPSG